MTFEYRSKYVGSGQTQKWFLFEVLDDNLKIEVEKAKDKEFKGSKWMNSLILL